MRANPAVDRLNFIIKTYGERQPWVVLDTLSVILPTIGVDHWDDEVYNTIRRKYGFGPETENRFDLVWKLKSGDSDMKVGLPGPERDASDQAEYATRVVADYRDGLRGRALRELLAVVEDPSFADGLMRKRHDADGIFPWVARELSKLTKHVLSAVPRSDFDSAYEVWGLYFIALDKLRASGNAVAQWAKLKRVDLMKKTLAEVLEAIKTFRVSAKVRQGKVVHKFENGWTVQELRGRAELEAEGKLLSHCVGSYCDAVDEGRSVIYSLRDPDGVPYITMEWQPDPDDDESGGDFVQIYGHQNSRIGSDTFAEYVFSVGQENEPPLAAEDVDDVVAAIRQMVATFAKTRIMKEKKPRIGSLLRLGVPLRDLMPLPPGAVLNGQAIKDQNLSGVDLSGASMRDTLFDGCDLRGANISNANAVGTRFVASDLRELVADHADLGGSWFIDCDISNARFTGANIQGSSWLGLHTSGGAPSFADARGIPHTMQSDLQAVWRGRADMTVDDTSGPLFDAVLDTVRRGRV